METARQSYEQVIEQAQQQSTNEKVGDAYIGLGNVHHARERYEEARDAYEQAMALGATDQLPYHHLVDVYAQLGDATKAIYAYDKATTLVSGVDRVETYLAVGEAYRQQKDFENALHAYHRALEMDENAANARMGMAQVYFDQKRWTDAQGAFEQTIAEIEQPDAAFDHHNAQRLGEAYCGLGEIHAKFERDESARGAFTKAIALSPSLTEAHIGLGALSLRTGHFEQAVDAFTKAAVYEPNKPAITAQLGEALYQDGQYEQAVGAFEKALNLDESRAESHLGLGKALLKVNWQPELSAAARSGIERALSAFEMAAARDEKSAEALIGVGDCAYALDRTGTAREAYEKAMRIGGDLSNFPYTRMGEVYMQTDAPGAALSCFNQAIERDEFDAAAHRGQGHVYFVQNRKRHALASFEQAMLLDDSDALCQLRAGQIYLDQDNMKKALAALERSVELDAEQADAWVSLGDLYKELGRTANANEAYEQAAAHGRRASRCASGPGRHLYEAGSHA